MTLPSNPDRSGVVLILHLGPERGEDQMTNFPDEEPTNLAWAYDIEGLS